MRRHVALTLATLAVLLLSVLPALATPSGPATFVANSQNVTMAHIHLAPAGVNGPVVVWLYPDAPPAQLLPGPSSGVLAVGTITEADLVGPLAGASLADLLDAMRAGNTYVNVHTEQYPGGEVRGQIR